MYTDQNPMTMFKEEQKRIAVQIRTYKNQRPMINRGSWDLGTLEDMVRKLSCMYRHRHIAYSLFRGNLLQDIEKKTSKSNKRSKEIFTHYLQALELDVLTWRRIKQAEYENRNKPPVYEEQSAMAA